MAQTKGKKCSPVGQQLNSQQSRSAYLPHIASMAHELKPKQKRTEWNGKTLDIGFRMEWLLRLDTINIVEAVTHSILAANVWVHKTPHTHTERPVIWQNGEKWNWNGAGERKNFYYFRSLLLVLSFFFLSFGIFYGFPSRVVTFSSCSLLRSSVVRSTQYNFQLIITVMCVADV